MAFDDTLAERIRQRPARRTNPDAKKMFGGIGFLLNGNLLVMGSAGMLAILVAGSLASTLVSADEPFRHVLIGAQATPIENWKIEGSAITPDCPTAWSIRKATLYGGKQEGVDIVEVDNGKLRFALVPTRGMGVVSVTMGDVRLGWDSPVKEIVHPQWINLQSRGGLGWLEGFNEWLVRCGLESNGHPGTDRFINNVGEEATMELTLHGRIANLPAQEVEVVVDRKASYRIHIRGRVDERMFYGPKLELHTEISTEPGASSLRISDTITNQGAQPQEFQILYHINYGRPLLEDGATFVAPVQRVTPFNDNAAKGLGNYTTYQGPTLVAGGNLNANKGGQAVVNVYGAENDKLTEWKYLGVLFQHPDANVKNIECPNFFKLGDKWVLIVSQGQPVQYFIGSLTLREGEGPPEPQKEARREPRPPAQTMRFKAEKRGVMDYGNYYAPNCMEDGKGRRVLWGWVNGFPAGRGWNGCLTLPRVLTLGPDGQLMQQPAPELQSLRHTGVGGPLTPEWRVTDLQLTDSSKVLEGVEGDTLEIMARLEPGDAKSCGIKIRRSADGSRAVAIAYDGKQLDVAGTRVPLALSSEKRTLELHIFADQSVLEVYANHGLCVTRVIDPGVRDLEVEIFSKGGSCKLQSLDVWPMKSI